MSVRVLNPVLARKAKEELGEEPDIIKSSLENLKQWIHKQPHLHNIRMDDQWLIIFLRGCKYSLEKAKKKIDVYNKYKVIYEDCFKCVDPHRPEIQKLLKSGFFLPSVTTTPAYGNPEVFIFRLSALKDANIGVENIFQLSSMISLILSLEYDNINISGQLTIIDANIEAKDLITFLNLTIVKKMITIFQDAWPVRQKGIHLINLSPLWDTIVSVAKMFMNEKNRSRLVFHKDSSTLVKYFPMEQLPKEYGGKAGSIGELSDYWKQKVESYKDWFMDDTKYMSDERKRIQSKVSPAELHGSFRKLNLD